MGKVSRTKDLLSVPYRVINLKKDKLDNMNPQKLLNYLLTKLGNRK